MRAVFCGIAKNVANVVRHSITYVEEAAKLFSDYKVVIYENDSTDGTLDILLEWQKNNENVVIISEILNAPPQRDLNIMAYARNKYLDYVKKYYNDYDILIVFDMDFIHPWDYDGIRESLDYIDLWNSVCSYGVFNSNDLRLYDAFAYIDYDGALNANHPNYWTEYVPSVQISYPDNILKPVLSCFGGLAIYKIKELMSCDYKSVLNGCEHIPFNLCVGNMYMNTNQKIFYW